MTTHSMTVDVLDTGVAPTADAAPAAKAPGAVKRAVGMGLLASYVVMTSFAVGFVHLGPVLDAWLATGI